MAYLIHLRISMETASMMHLIVKVHRDLKARRVPKDHKVHRVPKDLQEMMVPKVPRVILDLLEFKV